MFSRKELDMQRCCHCGGEGYRESADPEERGLYDACYHCGTTGGCDCDEAEAEEHNEMVGEPDDQEGDTNVIQCPICRGRGFTYGTDQICLLCAGGGEIKE